MSAWSLLIPESSARMRYCGISIPRLSRRVLPRSGPRPTGYSCICARPTAEWRAPWSSMTPASGNPRPVRHGLTYREVPTDESRLTRAVCVAQDAVRSGVFRTILTRSQLPCDGAQATILICARQLSLGFDRYEICISCRFGRTVGMRSAIADGSLLVMAATSTAVMLVSAAFSGHRRGDRGYGVDEWPRTDVHSGARHTCECRRGDCTVCPARWSL
jgi:hypothetical protein